MLRAVRAMTIVGAAALHAAPVAAQTAAEDAGLPIVVGHRGAPGYRPDHTLGSYEHAMALGADYVEPDLVMTKDGQLVARHEPEIGGTTDVAAKFPDRKRTSMLDGVATEGWFTEDFTLAELKTLRANQPLAFRPTAWDGLYEVPTLQEVIDLVKRRGERTGRVIGLYIETKHPAYFKAAGLDINRALVEVLSRNGFTDAAAPVFVQSFEVTNLKELKGMTGVRLIQLMDDFDAKPHDLVAAGDAPTYRDLMRPAELKAIAAYAAGIGPWKRTILAEGEGGALRPATSLIADAHTAGLKVHPYTFRDEPRYLAPDYQQDPAAEYAQFFTLGVDGLFSDFPDTALRARAAHVRR